MRDGNPAVPETAAKFAVAVTVLRPCDNGWEAVLVARKDDHSRWSLPGGKVDPGEYPAAAAVRELREETGIVTHVDELVPQETVLDSGGYLTTFYLLATSEGLPETFNVDEGEAPVRWGPVHELFDGPFGEENRERFRKMGIVR
jgi:8-oxo-dGTP pyrophosphatase MutT (NUDIX family)